MKVIDRKTELFIYKLFTEDKLVYIGQTANIQSRLEAHIKDKVFNAVEYIIVEKEDADCIEAYLIIEHNPPQNKTHRSKLFSVGRDLFRSKYSEQQPEVIKNLEFAQTRRNTLLSVDEEVRGDVVLEDMLQDSVNVPYSLSGGCVVERKDNGDSVRLSSTDVLIIAIMERIGVPATQDFIAVESRVERKTVHRLFKKLSEIGHDVARSGVFNFHLLLSEGYVVHSIKKKQVDTSRGHLKKSLRDV